MFPLGSMYNITLKRYYEILTCNRKKRKINNLTDFPQFTICNNFPFLSCTFPSSFRRDIDQNESSIYRIKLQ